MIVSIDSFVGTVGVLGIIGVLGIVGCLIDRCLIIGSLIVGINSFVNFCFFVGGAGY